jgi:UDP-glucose-4-epimerase GalE
MGNNSRGFCFLEEGFKVNVLVTGGAGYIGSHTCKALAKIGITPVAYDNLSFGQKGSVRWGPLVIGDLRDSATVRQTLRKYDIQAVFHFAAHAYVGESITNPRKYYHNNVTGSLALLDAMLDTGVRRLVFSSSCATYGIPQTAQLDETHPQMPVNPYGETKLAIERALKWYGEAFGLEWVALRYFNAAGADPDGEIGEHRDPETHLIPLALEAAVTESKPVVIFGTDYHTPDGTAIRDYIHVTDLARAHVQSLRYLERRGESGAFNLGLERGYSVREVIAAVERVSGCHVAVAEGNRRSGDPAVLLSSATRARLALGWQPEFLTLDEIVTTAWRWRAGLSSIRSTGNARTLSLGEKLTDLKPVR